MENDFLTQLNEISKEEAEILESKMGIKKSYYTSSMEFIIKGSNLLKDKQIDIRQHTRFTDFPLHGHDYMEIMYVYNGHIIHHINGHCIDLKKGDILFMNRHVEHSIDAAVGEDIGINFILSDNFLNAVWKGLQKDDILEKFISNNFKKEGLAEYLQFDIGEVYPIRNLLDNLIYSLSGNHRSDLPILPQAVTLLFGYLSLYKETLVGGSYNLTKTEALKREISSYITDNYKTATLRELAGKLGFTEEYLSRRISYLYGKSFRELLLERRLIAAEKLLLTTDMNLNDIIVAVGYENKSYFHRRFKEKHNITPHKWRKIIIY